jgi:hypothetical protein
MSFEAQTQTRTLDTILTHRGGAALVWGGAGAHPEIIKISPIPLFF